MAGDGQPGLPPFQLEVARMFFALPASRGFLLAGGAALLAQHLTARPTPRGPDRPGCQRATRSPGLRDPGRTDAGP
jgi:hypothetical protein